MLHEGGVIQTKHTLHSQMNASHGSVLLCSTMHMSWQEAA